MVPFMFEIHKLPNYEHNRDHKGKRKNLFKISAAWLWFRKSIVKPIYDVPFRRYWRKGQRSSFWFYRGQTGKNAPILLAMVSLKVANPRSRSWSLGVRPSSQLRRRQSALLLFSTTNPPFLRLKTVRRYLISLEGPPPNTIKSSFGQSKWESSFRSLMSTKPLDQTVSPLLYSEMLQLNSLLPLLDFSSCASTKNINYAGIVEGGECDSMLQEGWQTFPKQLLANIAAFSALKGHGKADQQVHVETSGKP